jgi:hypothetical protein
MNGKDEKHIWGFDGEIQRNETAWKIMYLKETGYRCLLGCEPV